MYLGRTAWNVLCCLVLVVSYNKVIDRMCQSALSYRLPSYGKPFKVTRAIRATLGIG